MLFGLVDYDEKTCSLNFLPGEDLADCLAEHKGFASILLDHVHKSLN